MNKPLMLRIRFEYPFSNHKAVQLSVSVNGTLAYQGNTESTLPITEVCNMITHLAYEDPANLIEELIKKAVADGELSVLDDSPNPSWNRLN